MAEGWQNSGAVARGAQSWEVYATKSKMVSIFGKKNSTAIEISIDPTSKSASPVGNHHNLSTKSCGGSIDPPWALGWPQTP